MFSRIITGEPEVICTIIAFAVAASIFLVVAWRATRMTRDQTSRFERIPFEDEKPTLAHERKKE